MVEAVTRKRVVVADDSELYLELLEIVLGEMRQLDLVGAASNGREAIRLAIERQADVVLLDVDMPIVDGFEAAAEIRRLRPQTEVLLHTALHVDECRRRGEQLELAVYDKLELPHTITRLAQGTQQSQAA